MARGFEEQMTVDARGKTGDDNGGDVFERDLFFAGVGRADELSIATRQIDLRLVDADDVIRHDAYLSAPVRVGLSRGGAV